MRILLMRPSARLAFLYQFSTSRHFGRWDVKGLEEDGSRHGGELVAQVLQSHGVKYVFTLVGGHISPILVAAEKLGIRIVDTRHEVTTVFAADAVARLSGTVGVAAVTAGPGLTNTVTAVKNAQMAESPVVLLGGTAATLLKGRGALQDIDQMALFKPLCKYTATVKKLRDIVPVMKQAFREAQSDTPGPVFVELPIDVLYPYTIVKKESGVKSDPKGLKQKLFKWYIDRYLRNLFSGAFEPQDLSPLPVNITHASPQKVQHCAELLSKAKKPLLLIGSQATLPPTAPDDLRWAVQDLGIPCFLGGMARGLLGKTSPLQMRQQRKDALQEADLVILAGAVCDFRLSYGRILSRNSKIISVNRSKEQMLKNSDQFWKADVAIQADVGSFLASLSSALKGYNCDPAWISKLRERDNKKETINRAMTLEPADQHLNPIKVLHDLDDCLDDNAIMVADGGDFVGSAAYILRPRGPLRWLDPGAFGTLGVGAGFALGAKLCRPEAQVVIVYGDGSAGYSIMEYDTFRRHKIPVMSLVGNDACWMQILREQVPMFGSAVACNLEYSDYHKVAESLGAKGYVVGADDKDRLKEIFQEAIKANQQGQSVLINALIGKTKFREGSLSV